MNCHSIPWDKPLDPWKINRALKLKGSDVVVNGLVFEINRGPVGCFSFNTNRGQLFVGLMDIEAERIGKSRHRFIDEHPAYGELLATMVECDYSQTEPVNTQASIARSVRYSKQRRGQWRAMV